MRQIWDRFEPKTKSKKTNSNFLEFYFLIFCTMFKSGPDSPISHYSSILNSNWHRGVVVITTAKLHSSKPELRFCAGSNPARGVSEIRDGEDLWQWSRLEIRLRLLSVNHTTKKLIIIHHHHSSTKGIKLTRFILFEVLGVH